MESSMLKFIILCSVLFIPLTALIHDDPDQLLEWCIDATNHKTKPGPEDVLHRQCKPWRERSCCTLNTSVVSHYTNMYGFDWNHCSHVKYLSDKCRQHFIQDLCFYECSPNVGPWVVSVEQKIRKQRFVDVPLCATDCDKWFDDCSDDYTCTDNWARNFDWVDGTNKCPAGSSCQKFKDIYRTSKAFCERVWDHSWKYTSDDEYCMRLWFNSSFNPNDRVAKWRVEQIKKKLKAKNTAAASSMKFLPSVLILGILSNYVQ